MLDGALLKRRLKSIQAPVLDVKECKNETIDSRKAKLDWSPMITKTLGRIYAILVKSKSVPSFQRRVRNASMMAVKDSKLYFVPND